MLTSLGRSAPPIIRKPGLVLDYVAHCRDNTRIVLLGLLLDNVIDGVNNTGVVFLHTLPPYTHQGYR